MRASRGEGSGQHRPRRRHQRRRGLGCSGRSGGGARRARGRRGRGLESSGRECRRDAGLARGCPLGKETRAGGGSGSSALDRRAPCTAGLRYFYFYIKESKMVTGQILSNLVYQCSFFVVVVFIYIFHSSSTVSKFQLHSVVECGPPSPPRASEPLPIFPAPGLSCRFSILFYEFDFLKNPHPRTFFHCF